MPAPSILTERQKLARVIYEFATKGLDSDGRLATAVSDVNHALLLADMLIDDGWGRPGI